MASDTRSRPRSVRRTRLGWLDRSLGVLAVGSLSIVAVAALVQASFGAYTMSLAETWRAVFDPVVWTNPQVWLRFLLGDGTTIHAFGHAIGIDPAGAILRTFGLPTAEVDLPTATTVVWNIRLPRVVVGVLVGANLAVSGAIFQAITRNELASPYVLGVSSGAGLAILLTLVVFSGLAPFLPLIASAGGAAAFLVVYAIAWKGGTSPIRLVLAGVIVGTMFGSLQTGLFFFADDLGVVQSAIAWTTGSLTGTDWAQVRLALPWTIVSVTLAIAASRQLNVLSLGERTAASLGMSVEHVRFAVSGVAILAASAAIAVAGIVGFVGLIVPHVVRNVVGSDYRRLVVGCAFAGPALLVGADVGARLGMLALAGSGNQLPVGVVTGLVGGPYFLYLMRKRQRLGEL